MKQLLKIALSICALGSHALSQPVIVAHGPASSTVSVSVILPAMAKIVSASRIESVAITAADIKNGCKDLPAAATLTIWSNARNGFILRSRLVLLKAVKGSNAAGILVLGKATGAAQLQPLDTDFQDLYQGTKMEKNLTGLSVDLKLLINPKIEPGLYQIEPEFSVSCL